MFAIYNRGLMQVLQAGQHKWIFLELEGELVSNIAKREGFDAKLKDSARNMIVELRRKGGKRRCCYSTPRTLPISAGSRAVRFTWMAGRAR